MMTAAPPDKVSSSRWSHIITVLQSRGGAKAAPLPTALPGGCAAAQQSPPGQRHPQCPVQLPNQYLEAGQEECPLQFRNSVTQILRISRKSTFSFCLQPFPTATSSQGSNRWESNQGRVNMAEVASSQNCPTPNDEDIFIESNSLCLDHFHLLLSQEASRPCADKLQFFGCFPGCPSPS